MKSGIHPDYVETTVHCGCGNTFTTRSTKKSGHIAVEVCSQCHPFYTGKQKILDSGGRVARFEKRYGKRKGASDDKAGADKYRLIRRPICRASAGRASVCVPGKEAQVTDTAPAIDALLTEHAELERRLADPELNADQAAARQIGGR